MNENYFRRRGVLCEVQLIAQRLSVSYLDIKQEKNSGYKITCCLFNLQDEEAMEYLLEVGPDTMIPCFSVNLKGNRSVEKCNEINVALFQDLCHTSSEQTARRVPMIVTASSLVPHKHSAAVPNFKKRLGVGIMGLYMGVKIHNDKCL